MKWLLVTTNPEPFAPDTEHPHGAGWNVGDVFARLGTELLIRDIDPEAAIEFVNMDSAESIKTEREFDRAVFAGRPMFWDGCETHPLWTELLNGWLCRDPSKVLALGVGDCYRDAEHAPARETRIRDAAACLWRLVVRFPVDSDRVVHSVCPSTWLLIGRNEARAKDRLCNFMPAGGHYPEFAREDAEVWLGLAPVVARILRENGFDFIAHTLQELEHARELGWPSHRVHVFTLASHYLDAYSRASHYFGNRMHGAAILAGTSARAVGVGFDSRLAMLTQCGVQALRPAEVRIRDLMMFCRTAPRSLCSARIHRIANERAKMTRLLVEFAAL